MADPQDLKKEFAANQKLDSVDVNSFRAGIAQYGPFNSFSGINRDDDVRNRNGNNKGVAIFDKLGPFSRAGWSGIQDWARYLSGHPDTVLFPAGSPPDGLCEIEGIKGDDPTALENRINLKTGMASTDYTFREDGSAN